MFVATAFRHRVPCQFLTRLAPLFVQALLPSGSLLESRRKGEAILLRSMALVVNPNERPPTY